MSTVNFWNPVELDRNVRLYRGGASPWGGIAYVIKQLLEDFNVGRGQALEFGCEYGYSTAVLANYFDRVVAVDVFTGDIHSGPRQNFLQETQKNLIDFPNIELIQSDYRDFEIKETFDLVHIDIVHTYEDTLACGQKALKVAPVLLLHDTVSFPDVFRAMLDLAAEFNCDAYNYLADYGLGILVKKEK